MTSRRHADGEKVKGVGKLPVELIAPFRTLVEEPKLRHRESHEDHRGKGAESLGAADEDRGDEARCDESGRACDAEGPEGRRLHGEACAVEGVPRGVQDRAGNRREPRYDVGHLLGDAGKRRGRLLLDSRLEPEDSLEGDIRAEARDYTQKKEYKAGRYRFEHLSSPSRT